MKHRIFIAINLPEDIKETLLDYQNNHQDVPAKWVPRENLHITAVFIGDADDNNLPLLHKTIERATKGYKRFNIGVKSIGYNFSNLGKGGIKVNSIPRMIWASGESNKEFITLCDNLCKTLANLSGVKIRAENREIIPHITLARIKELEWRRIEPEERPEVEESIEHSFEVGSVELMESILKKTGPEYKILESYKLN